jgi:hypothetical protein
VALLSEKTGDVQIRTTDMSALIGKSGKVQGSKFKVNVERTSGIMIKGLPLFMILRERRLMSDFIIPPDPL